MLGKNNISGNKKEISWANGTDEEIIDLVARADAGEIDLGDYWAVGDERFVVLPAIPLQYYDQFGEQVITLVLLNKGGKTLTSGKECNFIVGLKESLYESGRMNTGNHNVGSWNDSARRNWCDTTFKNAMLSTSIGAIFKQHYNITAEEFDSTTNVTTTSWFALPAAKEVFGGNTATSAGNETSLSNLTEFNALK